jgi:tetratricopeptide (TPR) repeat protein
LIDKRLGRELLYVNPVYQPGNLALRNAWFSGGIEWNMAVPAHSPFTCSKPFFAILHDNQRGPVLRMYEWERIRCAPFQVDFYLPSDSHLLYVRTVLSNPHQHEIPAYWFSNIAVGLSPDVRVLVPATFAYTSGYEAGKYALMHVDVPLEKSGFDNSYPYNGRNSRDIFYRVDAEKEQPWIAAVDRTGKGLFQTSTSLLKGRKMFVWGVSSGGNRWQEFLSDGNNPYFEIQAGLGRTQAECVPLKGLGKYEWLEAYGLIEAEPHAAHNCDWADAIGHVKGLVQSKAPIELLDQELVDTAKLAQRTPDEIIQYGSGWGRIEAMRRSSTSAGEICGCGLVFCHESVGQDEEIWAELIEKGFISSHNRDLPGGYMSQEEWIPLLLESIKKPGGDNWLSRLHLGVLYYSNDEQEKAVENWKISAELKPNIFALRNIGFAAGKQNEKDKAIEYYSKAWQLNKADYTVTIEFLDLLIEQKKHDLAEQVFSQMPRQIADHPRVLVAKAKFSFITGDFQKAEILLESIILPDLREGDTALTDMWFEIQAQKIAAARGIACDKQLLEQVNKELTPPRQIDFRMADL